MTPTTILVTFGASAVQPVTTYTPATRLLAEPLASNTHRCYIGGSNVTNDGSGTGVIRELAAGGAATVPLDTFLLEVESGDDQIDMEVYWFHGTTGEKLKLSYWIA